jgi:phage portal protein BeeE
MTLLYALLLGAGQLYAMAWWNDWQVRMQWERWERDERAGS